MGTVQNRGKLVINKSRKLFSCQGPIKFRLLIVTEKDKKERKRKRVIIMGKKEKK